jgi:hypothetical protein
MAISAFRNRIEATLKTVSDHAAAMRQTASSLSTFAQDLERVKVRSTRPAKPDTSRSRLPLLKIILDQ